MQKPKTHYTLLKKKHFPSVQGEYQKKWPDLSLFVSFVDE